MEKEKKDNMVKDLRIQASDLLRQAAEGKADPEAAYTIACSLWGSARHISGVQLDEKK